MPRPDGVAGRSDGGIDSGLLASTDATVDAQPARDASPGAKDAAGQTSDASFDAATDAAIVDAALQSDCHLIPDHSGWIARSSNASGVQGQVRTFTGRGSVITPPGTSLPPFPNDGSGKLCMSGTTAAVEGQQFGSYYGAGLYFALCATPDTDAGVGQAYTVSECPDGAGLLGFRFVLSGASIPEGIRLAFHERGRSPSTYVVARPGFNEVRVAEATVAYDPTAAGPNPLNVDYVYLVVPSVVTGSTTFDFCLEAVEVVTARGPCGPMSSTTP
jgi:hypothetical protein